MAYTAIGRQWRRLVTKPDHNRTHTADGYSNIGGFERLAQAATR